MSPTPEVKRSRYSLRPTASAFDLCINRNRYGLVRRTIDRQAKLKSTKSSPNTSASSSPSRSPSPVRDINKRKIRYEPVEINNAKRMCDETIQSNQPTVNAPKLWQLPNERTQIVCKPPPTLYDVSKGKSIKKIKVILTILN